jgi:hypothetical protein
MIVLTGPCSASCQPLNAGTPHYRTCIDRPDVVGSTVTKALITTALP